MAVALLLIPIGFIAGVIAITMPGPNSPKGFLLTTALGIAGAPLQRTHSVW